MMTTNLADSATDARQSRRDPSREAGLR
jgi:hypothetical protein